MDRRKFVAAGVFGSSLIFSNSILGFSHNSASLSSVGEGFGSISSHFSQRSLNKISKRLSNHLVKIKERLKGLGYFFNDEKILICDKNTFALPIYKFSEFGLTKENGLVYIIKSEKGFDDIIMESPAAKTFNDFINNVNKGFKDHGHSSCDTSFFIPARKNNSDTKKGELSFFNRNGNKLTIKERKSNRELVVQVA